MSSRRTGRITRSNQPAFHYETMLADRVRMNAYQRAIQVVVGSGQVVADLGTGTGVLAVMAARAGARRVYAVEQRPAALDVARRIARDNGVAGIVSLVEGNCREVELPEPVDVVVNELIGDFGTDEGIVESVSRFASRNLAPGGRLLPQRLRTFLAPVAYAGEYRGVWSEAHCGLDLRSGNAAEIEAQAELYALRQRPIELAAAAVLEDVVFGDDASGGRAQMLPFSFEVTRAGALQGFAGWFEATLAEGITLSTLPCYPGCHWRNWHWPLSPPVSVAPGERITGVLHAPDDVVARGWRLDWQRG